MLNPNAMYPNQGLIASLPAGTPAVSDPQGTVPEPFSFPLSQMSATQLPGGTVKIVDSTTFKVATKIAVAVVTVEPGGMRCVNVLHLH